MKNSVLQDMIEFKDNYYRILFKKFFKDRNSDMFPTDQMALIYLLHHGQVSLKDLSGWLNLEKGSLTTVARRLQEAGLAIKVEDKMDRRSILLSISEKGILYTNEWLKDFDSYVERLLAPYTAFEKESIIGAIGLLNAFMEQMDE